MRIVAITVAATLLSSCECSVGLEPDAGPMLDSGSLDAGRDARLDVLRDATTLDVADDGDGALRDADPIDVGVARGDAAPDALDSGASSMDAPDGSACSSPPCHLWSRALGGASFDAGAALSIDTASGDVYVIGWMRETVTIGSTVLVSAGDNDGFVVALDAAGAPRWATRFGGPGFEDARAIEVDEAARMVLIGGTFTGTASIAGVTLVAAGPYDGFVAAYTLDGAPVWARRFGGDGPDSVWAIATDASGDAYVVGDSASATVDFGSGAVGQVGADDAFLFSLSPTGTTRWARRFGSFAADRALAVVVDAGRVYLTGEYQDGIDFGGGTLSSAGLTDVPSVSVDAATGAHLASAGWGGAAGDNGIGIGVAPAADRVCVVGGHSGGSFGGAVFPGRGLSDALVACYRVSTGAHIWSAGFGGEFWDYFFGPALAADGTLYVAGLFQRDVDFGGGVLSAAGSVDGVLAGYGPDGAHLFSLPIGGPGRDDLGDIELSATGVIYVTGSITGPVSVGGDPIGSVATSVDALVAAYRVR